jgi:hypothetical protein
MTCAARLLIGFMLCALLADSASAQGPVPEFYGLYALQDGQLTELKDNADSNDFGPAVRFVLFLKGMVGAGPVQKMFFLPPEKPKDSGDGQFKGWDDFFKQSQQFSNALGKYLEYGVPSNAVEVQFQVGPYGNSNEMVRVVPRQELPAGFYQLAQGVRFWVRKADVATFYSQAASTSQAVNAGNGPAISTPSPAAEASKTAHYPMSSGVGTTTQVTVFNETLRPVQIFLDDSDTPISLRGISGHKASLEIGSTHILKAVVGSQVFQARFTVPRVMRRVTVSSNGIQF